MDNNTRKIYYLDLLERVVWTFVQGFCAVWIMTGDIDGMTLGAAAVAGALAVAKAIVGKQIGDRNSAATLPRPPDYVAPNDPQV